MSFILPLPLGGFQIRHHRIVTYGKHIYLFVPHSHANLHFLMLLDFSPFESSWLLSFWILIQAPLSIVSFCVRDILILTHGQRRTLAISFILMWFSTCFDTYCFLGYFESHYTFGFQFMAWDYLSII